MTRRDFAKNLAATAAGAALSAAATHADEAPPDPKPGDAETERLLAGVEAEVTGGLTEPERARVREQVRGMTDFLAPLRKAELGEGAEPSFAARPVLPDGEGKKRQQRR